MLCCELCPRVYHAKCLKLPAEPEGDWFCPECEVSHQRFVHLWVFVGLYCGCAHHLHVTYMVDVCACNAIDCRPNVRVLGLSLYRFKLHTFIIVLLLLILTICLKYTSGFAGDASLSYTFVVAILKFVCPSFYRK